MPIDFEVAILYQALTVVLILLVTYLIGRILSRFFRETFKKAGIPETQTMILASIIKYSTYLIGTSIALGYIDIPIVSLWIALVLGVAIVGFTAHSALDNLFSGYFIRTYAPFSIGDVIEMEGQMVKVKDVAPLNTIVETSNHLAYSIPNSKVMELEFFNYTQFRKECPVELNFEIVKTADLEDVKLELLEIISSHPKVSPDQPVQIYVQRFTDRGVIMKVLFFVPDFHIKSGAKDYLAEGILKKFQTGTIPLLTSNDLDTRKIPGTPLTSKHFQTQSSPENQGTEYREVEVKRKGAGCPKCDSHDWYGFLRCKVCGSYFLFGKCKNCDYLRLEECPIDGGRVEFINSGEEG
ncbi:MAG: mechanosensitive ion channel family protein [Thermoproteota archaeon]